MQRFMWPQYETLETCDVAGIPVPRRVKPQLVQDKFLTNMGLVFNTAIRSVICLGCKVVLVPTQISAHMGANHKEQRIRVDKEKTASVLKKLGALPSPPTMRGSETVDEIEGLAVHEGVGCGLCDKVLGVEGSMSNHYRVCHEGAKRSWKPVKVQQLNRFHDKGFFRVHVVRKPEAMSTVRIVRELRERQVEMTVARTGNSLDPRMVSPWIRSTRWGELVEGKDVGALMALVDTEELPGLTEAVQFLLYNYGKDFFKLLPELALQKLNSPDPAKSGINNSPLKMHMDHETRMKDYGVPVVRLVAMLLRGGTLLTYHLPKKAIHRLALLKEYLDQKKPASEVAFKVLYFLGELWTNTWVPTGASPFPDPTINMLALSMLNEDGSFKHPTDTTGPIAKLQYCMRTVFMCNIWRKGCSHMPNGYMAETDRLAPWYTEKFDSTFNSLRSLQHRASAIALATTAMPNIWWLDRKRFQTMLYRGHEIEFGDVRKMFVEMERVLVEKWEKDVLCGLELRIEHDTPLKDDLGDTRVGYSFVSDSRNPFCEDRELLMRSILDDPQLRERFVGGTDEDGGPIWNHVALKLWLYQYGQFEGYLLVRCETLGGAPGRMTELTAMTFGNVPSTTHRNLFALGPYLAMLVMYHKGTAMTGEEKLIPHAFDGVSTDLMVQNLAIARPFAELVVSICYPENARAHQLYADNLFVNNGDLFTTPEVSAILKDVSRPIIGMEIGVRSWRHICLAFKRKLCSGLEDLIEIDGEDTAEAQQATHSRKTENRLYGLSADSLSGVAEDVLPLYLDASTDWQIECKAVPGGLGLDYHQARAIRFDELVQVGAIQRANKTAGVDLEGLAAKLAPMLSDQLTQAVVAALGPAIQQLVEASLGES